MGFFSVLRDSLVLLAREPALFIPKIVSTLLYLPPYLIIMKAFAAAAKDPLLARDALSTAFPAAFALLAIMPAWLFLDSLYPVLVQQRRETGRIDFRSAAGRVLGRFLRVLLFSFLMLAIFMLIVTPLMVITAFGFVTGLLALAFAGLLAIGIMFLVSAIAFYFSPTALLLGNEGVVGSVRRSISLSRENFPLVFFLTLASFAVLLLGMYAEGAFEPLGDAGFVAGRLLGAVVTVYLYVVNPSAYLDVHGAKTRS